MAILPRKLALIGLSVLLAATLAACGQGGKGGNNGKFTFTMMNQYTSPEPPSKENPIIKRIEEYTNTKINATWIPASAYNDKVNVSIASNDLPQVLMIQDTKSSSIINAQRSGMFWEIGPYLKDYPNLSKYNGNETVLNNISVDGKVYGLYRARALARQGIVIRQDWLDNLGLEQPKTIDDLYQIIKAFTLDDPAKSGSQNTFGLVEAEDSSNGAAAVGLTGFQTIAAFFGAPNQWEIRDGKAVPQFMTDENMEAMKFYKRLYDEKLINQDFAATKTSKQQEQFFQGKAGVIFTTLDFLITGGNELKKVDPEAKLDIISRIEGPKGERVFATTGYNGMFVFPKATVKTEADLKKLLEFFDKIVDEEMMYTWTWGIEGRHHEKNSGEPAITDQTAYSNEVSPLKQLPTYDGALMIWKGKGEADNKFRQMMQDNESIIVSNPVEPLISQTAVEKGTELNKIITDARIKFIMGTLDEDGFYKEVEKWRAQGGDQIIADYTELYAQQSQK